MKPNFNKIISRKNTHAVKWLMSGDDDVLPFGIADMEFACPIAVRRAMKKRINKKIFGYTAAHQYEYLTAIYNWYKKRFDWEIEKDFVHIVHSVLEGITNCIKAFTEEGNGIIIQEPVYSPFRFLIETEKRQAVVNVLINKGNGNYEIDFDNFETLCKDKNNKMFVFCSPHNPVGRVWTKVELEKIADICEKNDVTVVSDEIHCDIVRSSVKHIPLAKLRPDNKVITCISVGKSFNLAGIEIASVVFPSRKMLDKVTPLNKQEISNPLSIAAATAAYDKSENWLNCMNDYVDQNFAKAKAWFDQNLPKLNFFIPQGTYLAWIDISQYVKNVKDFVYKCKTNGKILVYDGGMFGQGGENFLRLNFACPWKMVEEGLERLKEQLLSQNKQN